VYKPPTFVERRRTLATVSRIYVHHGREEYVGKAITIHIRNRVRLHRYLRLVAWNIHYSCCDDTRYIRISCETNLYSFLFFFFPITL